MDNDSTPAAPTILERTYPSSPQRIWELWTTPDGISAWWAPDGFTTVVDTLDLRPGGALAYTMTATGPEQIAFMQQAGMPLATRSFKTFTEVDEPSRLAYTSLIDFVPDCAPDEHLTVVTFEPTDEGGTRIVMQVDPMHDEVWTERILAGRANELDNLGRQLGS